MQYSLYLYNGTDIYITNCFNNYVELTIELKNLEGTILLQIIRSRMKYLFLQLINY